MTLAKAIRIGATAVSLVVVLALCLFAADQFAAARDSARADLADVGVAGDVDGRESAKGWLREDVDAVAGAFTAPFAWAGAGDEPWLAAGGPRARRAGRLRVRRLHAGPLARPAAGHGVAPGCWARPWPPA